MNKTSIFIHKTKLYIAIFFFAILLIYGCGEKTTEVTLAIAPHCIESRISWPAPEGCTADECCATASENLISFSFTRTDVPNPEPIFKNPLRHSYAQSTGMCISTGVLLTEKLMEKGFGRWQVTNAFAPSWEFTCDEININEQTRCMNYPPFPGTPGDQVVDITTEKDVDGCEVEIIDFE